MSMVRRSISIGVLAATVVASAGADAPAPHLLPGDPLPELAGVTWIAAAPPDDPADAEPTVLIFWATWCPASRAVLTHLDSLLSVQDQDAAFRVTAVAWEHPAQVGRFLEGARWRRLTVGCNPNRSTYESLVEAAQPPTIRRTEIPFALIHGSAGEGAGSRLLWTGSVLRYAAEDPLGEFEQVLREICAGTYDLAAARASADAQARVDALLAAAILAGRSGNIDTLSMRLAELEWMPIAPGQGDRVVDAMNSLAWGLATAEGITDEQLAVARSACRVALTAGGMDTAFFIDTYARVLFESGDPARAAEVQESVVALADELGFGDDARAALARYREAAGLPAEADPAPVEIEPENEIDARIEKPLSPWHGSVNDVSSDPRLAGSVLIVGPAAGADSAWEGDLESLRDRFHAGAPLLWANEVTPGQRRERTLYLYGTPLENPITQEVLDYHGMALNEAGVRVGDVRIAVPSPTLITAVPNPWAPQRPVVIHTAWRATEAHGLNSFFHGPTALMVGRWDGRSPVVEFMLDYRSLGLSELGGLAENALELALADTFLTAAQAAEDLEVLRAQLEADYAGYLDIAWDLRVAGSSWSERTARFTARIYEQEVWAWADLFHLFEEYLDPGQDFHFSIRGTGLEDGCVITADTRLIDTLAPFFADAVARAAGDGYRLDLPQSGNPLLDGAEVVTTPHATPPDQPRLFPTLPAQPALLDSRTSDTYLLGVLADSAARPETLRVSVRGVDGVLRAVVLPLHRGRLAENPPGRGSWSVTMPPRTPVPVLAVRTMVTSNLQGMAGSADSLRALPRLVLDLRQNGGGSDEAAIEWVQRFSRQPFNWIAFGAYHNPHQPRALRWRSAVGASAGAVGMPSGGDPPTAPFGGRLLVLVDKQVASSGETFTQLAGQVRGALIVGENTAGCVTYGNVTRHEPLPHSGISASFGRTKFVEDWVRENREGVGFFPDYWLDVADPVALLADYLKAIGE